MIKSFKVKLKVNNKIRTFFNNNCSISRFAYNWALNREIENHKNGNKFLSNYDLRKELTKLKKTEFNFLYNYDCNIPKQAIKDCERAFKTFFKNKKGYPKFKSKKNNKQSFFIDNYCIKIFKDGCKIPNLKRKIRFYEKNYIPDGLKSYSNPRITTDGIDWFLSVGVEVEDKNIELTNEILGIDLGLKELAVCSNGKVYHNNNKSKKIKLLRKRQKRIQRRISKKYKMNKHENKFIKTNNIRKLEKRNLKIYIKLTNIQRDYFNKVVLDVVRTKPQVIVLEDLNIKGILKNKHLSKSIQQSSLYLFKTLLINKANEYRIKIIEADRFYPSSKMCSNCGQIKSDLKLKDRVYKCDCGLEIDRDLNAAINLSKYPQIVGNLSSWRTKRNESSNRNITKSSSLKREINQKVIK